MITPEDFLFGQFYRWPGALDDIVEPDDRWFWE
jgi:hypothetical protein